MKTTIPTVREISASLAQLKIGEIKREELLDKYRLGQTPQSLIEEAKAYLMVRQAKLAQANTMALRILTQRIN